MIPHEDIVSDQFPVFGETVNSPETVGTFLNSYIHSEEFDRMLDEVLEEYWSEMKRQPVDPDRLPYNPKDGF